MDNRPYAESCDQNRDPIGEVLQRYVKGRHSVLEIGSGTGQHAVYFAARWPWLSWQTSDLAENHAGIKAWIDHSGLDNVLAPILLDVRDSWPEGRRYDLVFSANSLHIMAAEAVALCFSGLPALMHEESRFLVYGPFNYDGRYTSASNARFDQWLKQRDPLSGIRDFAWLQELGRKNGLECIEDIVMPANNRTLVWQKCSL